MATAFYGAQQSLATTSYMTDNNPQQDEQYISTFFCRALYDYQTKDASSLSFHKNDIIEVLTRLESGWWDGLLGEERGWFPSNYVTVITDQEAEDALTASAYSTQQIALADDSVVDIAHSLGRALSESSRDGDWSEGEMDYSSSHHHLNGHSNTQSTDRVGASDFWVPQVDTDGRIFYVNTQTGQQSQDLPQEAEEGTGGDLLSLTQSGSRSGLNGIGSIDLAQALSRSPIENGGSSAGFGLPRRNRTPEPWVRRLADDGMSYYYQNRITGQVSWTLPQVEEGSMYPEDHSYSQSSSYSASEFSSRDRSGSTRLRSDSSVSRTRDRSMSNVDRISIHSDDSGVQPRPRNHSEASSSAPRHDNGSSAFGNQYQTSQQQQHTTSVSLTPAEDAARSIQKILVPPPPETPVILSQHVQETVMSVVEYLQAHAHPRRPEQVREIDARILSVVTTVRNLLYITATPTGHIPGHLYPRGPQGASSNASAQALQNYLKLSHRKVAGTLSKLVLSSLAMQYDPLLSQDRPNRMESDAAELERSTAAFVVEVQRFHQEHATARSETKRLQGVFNTANVGPGLPGAGVAASWKGFGYAPLENGVESPLRTLSIDLISEISALVAAVQHQLLGLLSTVIGSKIEPDPERLRSEGQPIIAQLSALLSVVTNINIARHVDVDGIRPEGQQSLDNAQYAQTVERAQGLVRTLEAVSQAIYDDAALFFMSVQQCSEVHVMNEGQLLARHNRNDALINIVRSNLRVLVNTLESLLSLGQIQADIGQATYRNSIDWRKSRISVIDGNFDMITSVRSEPVEDVVDMELAFSRPGIRAAASFDTHGSSTLYHNGSQFSETSTSLDISDRSRSDSAVEPITPTNDPAEVGTLVAASNSPPRESLSIDDQGPLFDDEALASSKSPPRAGASKLLKLLGSDAPQHYITKMNADSKPWYLRPNYDQSEILIDPDGGVRAGTTSALVERLTAHEHGDPTFIKNFLMTFKSFMTLDELFELLTKRFWIDPPEGLAPAELEEWTKLKLNIIRMRVLNTFKSMVTDDELLEKEDMYILDRMKEFASSPEVSKVAAAKQLIILIERAQNGGDGGPIRTTNTTAGPSPPSIVPKVSNSKKLKLLDIDPLEAARQLTIMESNLYKKIRPIECLQRSRESKPGKVSDNITLVIQLSNRIANWVAESVLSREDSRKRAAIVKHFISIADRCRSLQNFSTMVAIISGLNTPPIRRLKRTWEQVGSRFMQQLGICESTIDSNKNFNNYRSTLARITPPCVPFIGVYLTTLTFINDGAEDKLGGHMVNFRKRQKAAETIQEIKRWQSKPYALNVCAVVLAYLEESFAKYADGRDYGDEFWHLSLEREPREREDEKMARLLQESGFL
ncbi:hypothetical protein ABKN59_002688 [Abortiporus biennis]